MGIPKRDVWIQAVGSDSMDIKNLGDVDSAPATFTSSDEIAKYIRDVEEAGLYQILTVDETVEVPEKEMFEGYTQEDRRVISEAKKTLENVDDVKYVSEITDPTKRIRRLRNRDVEIDLDPGQVDLLLEVIVSDGMKDRDVVDWVLEQAPGMRLMGWKASTYYEHRGDRGENSVEVALKRDVGSVAELVEFVNQQPNMLFVMWDDAVMFYPRAIERSVNQEMVVVTAVELPRETDHIDDVPTTQQVLEVSNREFGSFKESLQENTQWVVSNSGFVIRAHEETYMLAFGVQKQ